MEPTGNHAAPPASIHVECERDIVDAVCEWLWRCLDERDALLPWLEFLSAFARLRPDPRFAAVLAALGLGQSNSRPSPLGAPARSTLGRNRS